MKIPKRKSDAINRKRDNTTTNRKKTNNDLQNTTLKIKDWITRTSLQSLANAGAPERLTVPALLVALVMLLLLLSSHEWGHDLIRRQTNIISVIICDKYIPYPSHGDDRSKQKSGSIYVCTALFCTRIVNLQGSQ